MTTNSDEFLGEVRFGRRLTTWAQVAAGGLAILVGLLFLLPKPLTPLGAQQAIVAVVLAGIVLALTLASVIELLGGAGERGGTYTLVYEVLGGPGGFIAGWTLLGGSLALGAVLVRGAARNLTLLALGQMTTAIQLALGLLATFLLVQTFHRLPRRKLLLPFTVLLFGALGIIVLGTIPQLSVQNISQPMTREVSATLYAIAWLMIGYMLFEALLVARRLIRTPNQLLPRALIALLLIAGASVMIVTIVLKFLEDPVVSTDTGVARALGNLSVVPRPLVLILAAGMMLTAAYGALMTAARQLHALSLTGMLPETVRQVKGPFALPPLLFGVLGVITAPLIIWVPANLLVENTAALFLIALTVLNIAAIYSHQAEPDRRRTFEVPFYPLVPAVAISLNVALLLILGTSTSLTGAGAWLAFGAVLYVLYGRSHQIEAQEGILIFGRETQPDSREDTYRILLPIDRDHDQQRILRLATAIAQQRGAELVPLQIVQVPDPLAMEQGRRLARERNTLFQWSTRLAVDSGVPTYPITRLAPRVAEGILDTASEDDSDLILMPWRADNHQDDDTDSEYFGRMLEHVVQRAPCDVAVLAYRSSQDGTTFPESSEGNAEEESAEVKLDRILVPTAGGPHAPLAARLAVSLARQHNATLTVLYVMSPETPAEERDIADEYIDNTIATLVEQSGEDGSFGDITIERCIVEDEDVVDGIAAASADHDLVLIGASEERLVDHVVFGDIPEEVALASQAPVVMVKRYRGLRHFWMRRLYATLSRTFPQLESETQIEVYRQLRRASRPDIDFFIMIGLSAIIATFGLMQSSPAVIIGAMLVAPLFSPILGLSMAITRGDVRLLHLSLESMLKGVTLAIGLSAVFALLSPLKSDTPEILARTTPNLFDLGVALASGAAGAYATSREEVSAALPGVAIAAALVPPLGVVGFGLATLSLPIAQGSILLLVTNFTAIVLAGALMFLMLGFRPRRAEEREARLRTGLVTAGILLILVSIPLATVFVESVKASQTQQIVQTTLEDEFAIQLVDATTIETTATQIEVSAAIYAEDTVSSSDVQEINQVLSEKLGTPVRVSFQVISVRTVE